MEFQWSEWLNLIFRWIHVFAGILWVGTTYYFTWLDGRFSQHEKDAAGKPQVWMVHSGGFYVVEKQGRPSPLHPLQWFRWEAAVTWLSGILLLGIVYHMGGLMVDDTVADISNGKAIGIGFAAIIAGWVVYDLLAMTPLVKKEAAFAAVCFALVVAACWGLAQVLSGRAAYMHVGAIFGTIMAANVWMRILPAQRRMIAAAAAGGEPDAELARRAKLRSKHNTFLAVPVVFTMISSHFPVATYGSRYNWIVLAALVLVGWGATGLMRRA